MTDNHPVLYTASAGGYSATCDAFVRMREDHEDEGQIYFLSILGAQTALRAISGAMLKQRPDKIHLIKGTDPDDYEGRYEGFRVPYFTLGTWTFKTQKLALARGFHSLIYTKLAEFNFDRPEFVLIARNEAEAPAIHYQFLDKRSPLPFSPDWSDWLWERGLREKEITRLESFGVVGYYCKPDFDMLAGAMGKAIRAREITA